MILAEDVMMAGFVPLLSLPRLPTFVHQLVDKVPIVTVSRNPQSAVKYPQELSGLFTSYFDVRRRSPGTVCVLTD